MKPALPPRAVRGLYGRLGAALTELGVAREYELGGNRYPIFESALTPYDPVTGGAVGQALELAVAGLEVGIGTLRGRIERGEAEDPAPTAPLVPPVIKVRRRSFWYIWLPVGTIFGWLGGRNEALTAKRSLLSISFAIPPNAMPQRNPLWANWV